jgi:hypothetical protein
MDGQFVARRIECHDVVALFNNSSYPDRE